MVRPAEDADVDVALQRIRDAHEVAGHPIRSVALYYTLYHLAEIDGREEWMFDWAQHRDRLRRGLLGYGAYVVARELRHLNGAFNWAGNNWEYVDWERQVDALGFRLTEGGADPEAAEDVIALLDAYKHGQLVLARDGHVPTPLVDAEVDAADMERYGLVFSEPERFGWAADCLFNWGDDQEVDHIEPETGWLRGYGGSNWAAIARWLGHHGRQPTTVWVDTGLALAHNNGQFFDKMAYDYREYDVALEVTKQPGSPPRDQLIRDVTQDLLDLGRQGNVRAHGEFALQYQSSDVLSGNLRRVVDDLPGEGWRVPPEYREG
jgi:hypothetical protein